MKFTVERKHMQEAVKRAALAIQARNTIPALECVLITAADNAMTFLGADMDHFVRAKCEAAVPAPGNALVRADDLLRWLAAIPAGALITGELTGAGLSLSGGRARIVLPCLPHGDMPQPPQAEGVEAIGGAATFKALAPFCEGPGGSRFYLQGVLFTAGNAVATDGKAFCRAATEYEGPDVIVPALSARIINGLGDPRLFLSENFWRAEAEGAAAFGKMIAGTFPDWRVLDRGHIWFGEVDADALIAAVNAAIIGMAPDVFLCASNGALSASGSGWLKSVNTTSSECTYDGEDFAALVAATPLGLALAPHAGSVLRIGVSGQGAIAMASRDDGLTIVQQLRDPRNSLPSEARAAA